VSKSKKGAQGAGGKKRGSKAAAAATPSGEIKLSEHPRARHQIRAAKGWAGLGGFALAGYTAWQHGLPVFDTALRAILWGTAAYVLVWFCAVQVWRHIAIAEVRTAEKAWRERRDEAERVARERAAQSEQAAALAGSPRG
jgi:hypothetical protein